MSTDPSAQDRLDRHALVMAFWIPTGFVAACLLRLGYTTAGPWWIAAGFAAIIATFVGHIIINVVTGSRFTAGETALAAVVFAAAVLALLLLRLIGAPGMDAAQFTAFGIGLAALVGAVIIYMLIAFGPRGAFEKFDVIRDNNLRPASRLPHRGGRR